MAEDHIRYDILAQEALRGVMRKVLAEVARTGLPGNHHFFITFLTGAPGVRISSRLRERYPEQMTIVLQFQYWDLKVTETGFEVGLSFSDVPEKLEIPFSAVRGFYDPSVNFELEFEVKQDGVVGIAGRGAAAEKPERGRPAATARKAEPRKKAEAPRHRRPPRPTHRQRRRRRLARRLPQEVEMAEIVNLRQARKQKARAAKEQAADENRALHGRTKAEKAARSPGRRRVAKAFLDGHRRDSGPASLSLVRKHSVSIRGHRTSFSLEQPFFDDLLAIAAERGLTLAALVAESRRGAFARGQSLVRTADLRARLGKTAGPLAACPNGLLGRLFDRHV